MFRPQKTVAAAAALAKRELKKLSRPAGNFDASRYFRGEHNLGFYNTGTRALRELVQSVYSAHRDRWTLSDAIGFADALMPDRFLEVKVVGIEVVSKFHLAFTPAVLPACKRWLARDYSANWASTDDMCGRVIGPLLIMHPELQVQMIAWSRHRNMWVRRAAIVGLLPPVRRRTGRAVDLVYDMAKRLHADPNDLIHKAVGWALREAGKIDPPRLERYLRANVRNIPRTTFRYAIERFTPSKRRELLLLDR